MATPRRWAIVGTVAAVTGFTAGAVTYGATRDIELNDPAPIGQVADGVGAPSDELGRVTLADDSPESPDSPNESPMDSADSAADSPADSPAGTRERAAASSADSPGDRRVSRPAAANSANSANSPRGVGSANSGGSADSAGSAD